MNFYCSFLNLLSFLGPKVLFGGLKLLAMKLSGSKKSIESDISNVCSVRNVKKQSKEDNWRG